HPLLALGFMFALLPALQMTESRAAKLAFLLALVTGAVARFFPVFTRRALAVGALLSAGWPFYVQKLFNSHETWPDWLRGTASWNVRFEMWDYFSFRVIERPFFGWGLGSAHTLPLEGPHSSMYRYISQPVPHPHNAMVQLWVELGAPGVLMGILFMLFMLRQ